jgi:hypothetical protein
MVASAKNGLIAPYWATAKAPPQDVAQPVLTFTEPVRWNNPTAMRLRADYIHTVEAGQSESGDDFFPFAERARSRHWPVHILTADHDPEESEPASLVELIVQVTAQ